MEWWLECTEALICIHNKLCNLFTTVRYTSGENAAIGGLPDKAFICGKDLSKNEVYVCPGTNHPALFSDSTTTSSAFWISDAPPSELHHSSLRCKVRVRHRGPLVDCEVKPTATGLEILFDKPVRAVTPGQAAVLYQGNVCLGGACILFVLKPRLSANISYSLDRRIGNKRNNFQSSILDNILGKQRLY
jgi:tRNA-specific 2-thiouridylase